MRHSIHHSYNCPSHLLNDQHHKETTDVQPLVYEASQRTVVVISAAVAVVDDDFANLTACT